VEMLYFLRAISLIFVALALVPGGAHLLSMANKLRLDGTAYLASQRAYDGWNLLAIIVIGSLLSTLALTIALYRAGEPWLWAGLAFLCIVGTQMIFWTLTYPMNSATDNWTRLPPKWEFLRMQWEFSHAGSAVLNAIALVLLILTTVKS
jgi:hypothetical protein